MRNAQAASAHKTERVWFTRTAWGLSFQPKSREGWLLIALHLALVITWADVLLRGQTEDATRTLIFVTLVLGQTALLILIAYRTSES